MILDDILSDLEKQVGDQHDTLVIYSALWPLLRLANMPGPELTSDLCARILDKFSGRTLLMPTFTSGFDTQGICDLDSLPSQTGALSEFFRGYPGVRRTRSAFFSFASYGTDTSELVTLDPKEAWGEGSLYEWLHVHNAAILTLGLHPTHCSYTHYAEWQTRQRIPYRFNKTFSGTLIHEQVAFAHSETLFVRQHNPNPINDFTWLLPDYLDAGMQISKPHGFVISCMSAQAKMNTVIAALNKNPLALISNKEQLINHVR